MTATPAQRANTLITYFRSQHKKVLGVDIVINRHTAKWGMQDVIADLGEDRARELIDYFFKTNRAKYDMQAFLLVYDKLNTALEEKKADEIVRARLREQTRLKVEEWNRTHGED